MLTEGVIRWYPTANDFDWTTTTALPQPVVQGVFTHEPLWEGRLGRAG